MKPKFERLKEFRSNMLSDSFLPASAEQANAFLRKHMDAVEEASLPPEKLNNYTYRMMVPSFDIEGAWSTSGKSRAWEAFGHIIEIHECGSIFIRTKSGEQWFSLSAA